MTTLLDQFGASALTPDVRARIDSALEDAGLHVVPPISAASRQDTVQLALATDGAGDAAALREYSLWEPTRAIQASQWRVGERPHEIPLFQAQPGEGVLWFEVNVLHTEPEDVLGALEPLCPGLTPEIVANLFGTMRPESESPQPGDVRTVSAIGVSAEEPQSAGEAESKAGSLVFDPVELAAGDGWLITCRHESKTYRGAKEVAATEPRSPENLFRDLASRWEETEMRSSGDLGIAFLLELSRGYLPAIRELEAWLESWELDFYRRLEDTERETLIDLRGLLAELRRGVADLRSGDDPTSSWFSDVTSAGAAQSLQDLLLESLRDLRELNEMLRTSLDLVAASSSARQLRLAQEEGRRAERLQEQLALIAAVFLVPAIIAEAYGAAEDGPLKYGGYPIMIAVMALAGIISYVLFRLALNHLRATESKKTDR